MHQPPVFLQGKKFDKSAALFLADVITNDPGNVTVLALGPLTNLAMAFQSSPDVARDIVRSQSLLSSAQSMIAALYFNSARWLVGARWRLAKETQIN